MSICAKCQHFKMTNSGAKCSYGFWDNSQTHNVAPFIPKVFTRREAHEIIGRFGKDPWKRCMHFEVEGKNVS